MYALDLEFQILINIKMAYIKIKLPLNFAIHGVPKRVCVWQEISRDANDRIYHNEQKINLNGYARTKKGSQ